MDYTQSSAFAIDAGTTNRLHQANQAVTTAVSDVDLNMLIWELMEVQKAGGMTAAPFSAATPASYTKIRDAIRRITGGNVTVITAGVSPFQLTADNAGLVILDATGGNVTAVLPAVTNVISLPFTFARRDQSVNLANYTRSGTDVIDGVVTSVPVLIGYDYDTVRSAGIIGAAGQWITVAQRPSAPVVGVPAGTLIDFAASTAPTGYLKANGALVSRTVYASLFAAINTIYGVGDGSTTFALPDARGEFRRGWDDSRGVDAGRIFGSFQNHAVQDHTHASAAAPNGAQILAGGSSGAAISGFATGGMATGNIAAETRPRNVAYLICIKF